MDLGKKYNFNDFTLSHYRELVRASKEKYVFRFYSDFLTDEKFILWRHDVDFSASNALMLAEIESREGVKSTFFFHLHSEFYNLLENKTSDFVFEIKSLGHDIGVHFDPHYYGINNESEVERYLLYEKDIFQNILDVEVSAFSFHNPNSDTLKYREYKYSGLINVYAKYFQDHVKYCSDSNGYWRHDRFLDVLTTENHERIQFLTHPAWWTEKVMSPKEKIWHCIDSRAEKTKKQYVSFLDQNDRKLID